jgi:hypothetical protein
MDENPHEAPEPKERLTVALTILDVELLAVLLLTSGYSLALSFCVAVAVGTTFLTRRHLWKGGLLIAGKVRSFTLFVYRCLLDRRTYRFGLRSLLLMIVGIGLVCAWLADRHRTFHAEMQLLSGRWTPLDPKGLPILGPDGKPYTEDITGVIHRIDPFREPKWIDYYEGNMLVQAIYRLEGDELIIKHQFPHERLTSFDQTWYGKTIYPIRLRRLND